MLYQADYFIAHPDSKYSMLAHNVLHRMNEAIALAQKILDKKVKIPLSNRQCHKEQNETVDKRFRNDGRIENVKLPIIKRYDK
jgi:hypothetical protein